MRTLCRDIAYAFPNIVQVNRGKLSIEGIVERALELGAEKVIVVDRWKGGFGKMGFFEVKQDDLSGVAPIIYLRGAKFRRDFGRIVSKGIRLRSVAIASSSNRNFEAQRLANAFSNFFDAPALSIEKTINNEHHTVVQILTDSLNRITITLKLVPELIEIGPRLEISHLVWELPQ